MDPIKKRKIDENGAFNGDFLTADDARKILEPFAADQLSEIVQNALLRHPDVLDAVRSVADRDVTQRKLFIRGLGWETTTEKLHALFSSYGELDEAIVILDKATGKSKGYGFITFKHIDGAIMALKEPSKKIDGRMTVIQLAAAGVSGGVGASGGAAGGGSSQVDVSMRKIYVGNVPYDMPSEKLLQHFSMYGEVEEGPLGFDKATGKSKGFALFVYKTAEAARASLVDPVKNIDGNQLNCKLANDGKKGKPPGVAAAVGPMGGNQGNGDRMGPSSGFGGPYGGFPGIAGGGVGGPGLPALGNQAGLGFSGGGGVGGPYPSGYGGLGGGSGGALGGAGSGLGSGVGLGAGGGGYGGVGSGFGGASGGLGGAAGSGMGAAGRGSSMYGSAGMGSGDYAQSAHYSLSSGGYQGQNNQPGAPRVPPGGAYQGMPPYY